MENETEIKLDYLSGMQVRDICAKWGISSNKLYNKVGNEGWRKEKMEMHKKAAKSNEELIKQHTTTLLISFQKDLKNKKNPLSFAERIQLLRVLNDINGLKKLDPEDDKGKNIPQLNLIIAQPDNHISENPKLDKIANTKDVIDI